MGKMIIRMKKMAMMPFIKNLSDENKEFRVRSTGYSNSIQYDEVKRMMVDRNNFQVMGAYAKVKSVVTKINKKVPKFNSPTYYLMGQTVRKNAGGNSESAPVFKKVINIDIKSAYATCLFNNGFIDKATLHYLEHEILEKMIENFAEYRKIPVSKISAKDMLEIRNKMKIVRLKSIGMLATRTLDVQFKPGKTRSVWKKTVLEENKYLRSVFLWTQFEIGRIMTQIAKAYGPDFLFFWVDGIYVKREAGPEKAEAIMKAAGYKFHKYVLKNFKIWTETTKGIPAGNSLGLRPRPGGRELIKIEFTKDGEQKPFTIPTGKIARNW